MCVKYTYFATSTMSMHLKLISDIVLFTCNPLGTKHTWQHLKIKHKNIVGPLSNLHKLLIIIFNPDVFDPFYLRYQAKRGQHQACS